MNKFRVGAIALISLIAAAVYALPAIQASGSGPAAKNVTFNKEVAPIFYKSCAECHRPGEAAPFSVLSYKDVRPWAKSIKEKVVSRQMPPWHADPHVGRWSNDPRLTQAQVDTISAWVDGGAAEGNPKDLPPAPQFVEGWGIGKPDVIIQMPEDYTVEASGPDEYQYFDAPTNFKEDKYVQMAEARPGNRKVVHHIIAFVVPPGQPSLNMVPKEQRSAALEGSLKNTPFYRDGLLIRMKKDQPVYNDATEIPANLKGFNNVDDFLTAYAPGSDYGEWQPGTAKKIPAGATIRFQVHYSKIAGSIQTDRSMVGMIFAKQPPERLMKTRAVSNVFFEIPPNADHHKVIAIWKPSLDVTLYSLMPHMHYRGAAMEYKVFYPDGKSEVLLNVPAYSFNWQMAYRPQAPIRIPAGSKIQVTGYFDNSAKNKFNPDPTKAVRQGEPTYDEMMMGFMDYTAEKPQTLAKVDPQVFDTYVGKYDFGNNRQYVVTREGNRYFGQGAKNPKRELFPASETRFFIPEVESQVTFVKDEKGEVVELTYEQNEGLIHCKRIRETTAGSRQ
ncbi:MAG TPA: thiol-disulfide isomerase [Blastocatellia bacterium]|nr:thiol-disulfide isomerase [Blastocatellia bacterium]